MQAWLRQFRDLLIKFENKFPLPKDGDDSARAWIKKLAETFNFYFPAFGFWGVKARDSNSPQTTDCLSLNSTVAFTGWDVIFSSGSPETKLNADPESIDLTGQYFIPAITKDWLNINTEPPVPTEPTEPVPNITLDEVNTKCQLILDLLQKHFK